MHRNEFKTLEKYLQQLSDEKAATKSERTVVINDYKGKAFYSLIPLLLQKYPDVLVRDNLHVDSTFAVVFPKYKTFYLLEALNVYLDTVDMLKEATYAEVKQTGFITLKSDDLKEPELTGFWILLR